MKCNENIIALFSEPHKIELVRDSLTMPQEEAVCVEYIYCGICGGDYSVYRGYRNTSPISLGHEFVAKIISVGNSVKNLHPGQYVISDFNYRCGKCVYCKTNRSHLCQDNNISLFSNRGFARYANVYSGYLVPIKPPQYMPRACLIEPLSCVIHACHVADVNHDMNILICGGGGIGMLLCFLLRNVYQNVKITLNEKNPHKSMRLCKHFAVQEYTVGDTTKYDLVVDCSNSINGLKFSLDVAQQGSKICIMSHLYGLETSFVYEYACKKELHCTFPLRNGEHSNLHLAAEYIDRYWTSAYDDMLVVYDDIDIAFKEKDTSPYCKQIVRSSALFFADLR